MHATDGPQIFQYNSEAEEEEGIVAWLHSRYLECSDFKKAKVPVKGLYESYLKDFCLARAKEPKRKCEFGKHVKKAFPAIRVRRLGSVHLQTSFYCGILPRQSASGETLDRHNNHHNSHNHNHNSHNHDSHNHNHNNNKSSHYHRDHRSSDHDVPQPSQSSLYSPQRHFLPSPPRQAQIDDNNGDAYNGHNNDTNGDTYSRYNDDNRQGQMMKQGTTTSRPMQWHQSQQQPASPPSPPTVSTPPQPIGIHPSRGSPQPHHMFSPHSNNTYITNLPTALQAPQLVQRSLLSWHEVASRPPTQSPPMPSDSPPHHQRGGHHEQFL